MPAEFTSSTYGALAPEFSSDDGQTWTSDASSCSHAGESLSNFLVNFSRQNETTKTVSKNAPSLPDAVQKM